MIDVLFFSYRSTDAWWRYLAEQLTFATQTCVVSDMRGDGTVNIVDDFYKHLRQTGIAEFARVQLSDDVCNDIIRRCRVLRNLKKNKALSMIGAMWQTLDALIHQKKPRLVVSFIIDRYVLDVLDRVLQSHAIPFLGMTASIIPDHVMFMDRGRLISMREPDPIAIASARQLIVNDAFTPSYVNQTKIYDLKAYWRTFLLFKMRGLYYQGLRFLKRDRLNLHYLDALNHLDHKPRWRDYAVLKLFDDQWAQKLERCPRHRRVFVGLQLLPEASLDYWLDDLALLDNERVLFDVCERLSRAGFVLFVKDHPLQFGFRKRGLMQRLKALPGVVLVPYPIPATRLLQSCSVTVTMTGTIGFQSAVAGACSVVSNAYYSDDIHFVQCRSLADIATLPERIKALQTHLSAHPIDDASIDSLLSPIVAASTPGDLFSFKHFNPELAEHRQRTATLVDSLNRYLPQKMGSSGITVV